MSGALEDRVRPGPKENYISKRLSAPKAPRQESVPALRPSLTRDSHVFLYRASGRLPRSNAGPTTRGLIPGSQRLQDRGPVTAMATFEELETAACCLLQIIRDTPELGKTTRVAIAGSMAMQKHLPKYTQDGAAVSDRPSPSLPHTGLWTPRQGDPQTDPRHSKASTSSSTRRPRPPCCGRSCCNIPCRPWSSRTSFCITSRPRRPPLRPLRAHRASRSASRPRCSALSCPAQRSSCTISLLRRATCRMFPWSI